MFVDTTKRSGAPVAHVAKANRSSLARLWISTLAGALWLLAGALDSTAQAGLCTSPVVEKESPYQYLVSLADALTWAKSALDRSRREGQGPPLTDYDVLFGLKLGKADFECAKSQVSPYVTSKNEAIRGSAVGATAVFGRLATLQDETVAQYKAFLDSMGEKKLKLGTAADAAADLGVQYDNVWKTLVTAVSLGTFAPIEVEPSTGLMSRLALTRAQRDEILEKLHFAFGDEIKGGIKAGQIPLTAAAAALYQVLSDPHRKLRDSN